MCLCIFTGILSLQNLQEIHEHLQGVRPKWYNIGVQLRLPPGELDAIQVEQQTLSDCLREMIRMWLCRNYPQPTKDELCTALRSSVVDEARLAASLEAVDLTSG